MALCALPLAAPAASYDAEVTHVSDGDTLWVRPLHGGARRELRLAGIDAPEICQRHGPEAQQALQRLLLRQRVRVRSDAHDDYDRALARIAWRSEDVGGWMVRHGHAWSSRYRQQPGPYAQQERQARQARRGLWGSPGAVEPRAFRLSHGPCEAGRARAR